MNVPDTPAGIERPAYPTTGEIRAMTPRAINALMRDTTDERMTFILMCRLQEMAR